MSAITRPDQASTPGGAAVAGLAREVEALRRTVEPLRGLPAKVDELARLITVVADELAAHTAKCAPPVAPSWLMLPTCADTARTVLGELCAWLGAVYLRYTDAAAGLPECWCWHPDVIEELVWLMHAWLAAYQGPTASVTAAGDWHDRARPGVVRRIKAVAGTCSLDNHTPRNGHSPSAGGVPSVPLKAATDALAEWWGTHRDQPSPQPTDEHLAAAAALTRLGRGGRR